MINTWRLGHRDSRLGEFFLASTCTCHYRWLGVFVVWRRLFYLWGITSTLTKGATAKRGYHWYQLHALLMEFPIALISGTSYILRHFFE
jgi:hypothetical protein